MTTNKGSDALTQSRFITVIAWLTIVGSGIALLPLGIAALAAPLVASTEAAMPTLGALLVVCLVQFVTGIGLLQRRNWARLAMIVVLGITVLWQGSGLLSPSDVSGFLPESMTADPAVAEMLATVHQLMIVMALTIMLGSLWLIYRLMRADVKAEFGA